MLYFIIFRGVKMQEWASRINWLDILIAILLIRASYIGYSKGLSVEVFKLIGTLAALVAALGYYSKLSDIIELRSFLPTEAADGISFGAIVVASLFIFMLIRMLLEKVIKLQFPSTIESFAGSFFGLARGIAITSLILIFLNFLPSDYLKRSIEASFLGPTVLKAAPSVYSWIGNFVNLPDAPSY